MCYYLSEKAKAELIEERFNARFEDERNYAPQDIINGFAHLALPVILDREPNKIVTDHHWGLVPAWSKDLEFRKNTLNARMETIHDKPSFYNIVSNRCLVIATSFYEWRWLDEKGKQKEKYEIFSCDSEIFAFAGIYDTWQDYHSFSIVTTQANEQMSYIHNHKLRMPIMLNKGDESAWLDEKNEITDFAFPNYQPRHIGIAV